MCALKIYILLSATILNQRSARATSAHFLPQPHPSPFCTGRRRKAAPASAG
jgi:hypothetical protein